MSSVSGVASSGATLETYSALQAQQSTIDQASFLELLVAQLTNQDPMDPMSSENFTAQMAQFATLEGITSMNTNVKNLYIEQSMTEAAGLIGKTVTGIDTSGVAVTGTVTSVMIADNIPYLEVNEGQYMSLYNAVKIGTPVTEGA